MKQLTTSAIFILAITYSAVGQQAPPLSPAEIISRMAAVYSSCSSYADDGQVVTEFSRLRPKTSSFSTSFVRPSAFRFEFSLPRSKAVVDRYVVWKAGANEEAWFPSNSSASQQAVSRTLKMLPPATGGASELVPDLLMPELFRSDGILTSLTDLKFTRGETIDGRETFGLAGKSGDLPIRLWIDQQLFVVLKIQRTEMFLTPDSRFQTTITYKPQLNTAIPAERLAFNPPAPMIPPPNAGPANIEIVKFNWSRVTLGPDPAFLRARAGSGSPNDGPISPFPPGGGRLPVGYVYALTIRNFGEKEIRSVVWNYLVIDPDTKQELGRHRFVGYDGPRPKATASFKGILSAPPARVITVGGVQSNSLAIEEAEIRCVVYADGSWWQSPAVNTRECESFRRAEDLRRKR